jgi:hypothetical protein
MPVFRFSAEISRNSSEPVKSTPMFLIRFSISALIFTSKKTSQRRYITTHLIYQFTNSSIHKFTTLSKQVLSSQCGNNMPKAMLKCAGTHPKQHETAPKA